MRVSPTSSATASRTEHGEARREVRHRRETAVDRDRRRRSTSDERRGEAVFGGARVQAPSASGRSGTSMRSKACTSVDLGPNMQRSVSTACDPHAPIHPPPSSRSNSQPQGRSGTRVPADRRVICTCSIAAERAVARPARAACARAGVVAELEVAQRDHTRGARLGFELGRLVGVERERLVAQHRLARGEREAHVRRVQERRRVHADEIDVGRASPSARTACVVARRHDVDHLAAFGRRRTTRRDDPLARNPPPIDRDPSLPQHLRRVVAARADGTGAGPRA